MSEPWRGTRVVLERGDPWEILPSDMPHFRAHAEAYCASTETDPEGRARVRAVWLEGKRRPAWQKFTPVKGLAKRVTAQASGVTIEADTGEVVEDPF